MNSTKSPKPVKSAAKESSRVRNKRVKDPNAPKRAMTAFMYFSGDKRAEIRANNPNFKMPDVAKECGKLWREASEESKVKYQKMAEDDKKRYERESKDYKQ